MAELVEPSVQQLKEDKENAEAQLVRLRAEKTQLSSDLETANRQNESLSRQNESLTRKLNEETEVRERAEAELRREQEERAKLSRDLETTSQQKESLTCKLNEETEGRERAEAEIRREQEEKTQLSSDLEAANQQKESLTHKLNEETEGRERAEALMVALRRSNADHESRLQLTIKKFQMALEVVQDYAAVLENQLTEARAQMQSRVCEDEKINIPEKSLVEDQPTQADDDANSSLSEIDQPLQPSPSAIDLHNERDDANRGAIRYF